MRHLHPSVAGDINSIMIIVATHRPLDFLYLCAHLHTHTFLPGIHSRAVLTEGRRGRRGRTLPSVGGHGLN